MSLQRCLSGSSRSGESGRPGAREAEPEVWRGVLTPGAGAPGRKRRYRGELLVGPEHKGELIRANPCQKAGYPPV